MMLMLHEETEELIRNVGRRAYIYHWDDDAYRARRSQLAHKYQTSVEEIQLLCGEGWREALAEEQEEGKPLLYVREMRQRLEAWNEEELVWLADEVIEALETTVTKELIG
jgi:hypothetical protein